MDNWNSLDSEFVSPEDSRTLWFSPLAFLKDECIRICGFNGDFNGKWAKKLRLQSWRTLFDGMVETRSVLDSSHVRVPYGTNLRQWGPPTSRQERPKWPKLAKRVIFKGDSSLDALFQGYRRDSKCSRLITCQGTLWNLWKTMMTSNELSGTSKTAKNNQVKYSKTFMIISKFLKEHTWLARVFNDW